MTQLIVEANTDIQALVMEHDRRNLAAIVIAGLFSPTAYALYNCAMAGTMAAFVPQFLGTLVQGIGSGALFLVIAPALDGVSLKERMIHN